MSTAAAMCKTAIYGYFFVFRVRGKKLTDLIYMWLGHDVIKYCNDHR